MALIPVVARARLARSVLALSVAAAAAACVHVFRHVEVHEVAKTALPTPVESPIKAHLTDGTTIVFAQGAMIRPDRIEGLGVRYAPTDGPGAVGTRVGGVPLDSVLGMEVYQTKVDPVSTTLVSLGATVVTIVGAAVLALAAFGSCPTFYSDSAGTPALEAEGFSYSIAPLFERRDVDRLRAGAHDGVLELELRNEALETHYLNHVQLLETHHARDEWIAPDDGGQPIAVRGLRPAISAIDRAGRDVSASLAASDGALFATAPSTLAAARVGDLDDHVDLTVPVSEAADSVALVFRMRNSLLNSVLLYESMLSDAGARALDWEGRDLDRIGDVLELGRWYAKHMGMRISVYADGTWREAADVADAGPIAFHDLVVVIPVVRESNRRSARVRLTFTADNWRIDRVAVASSFRRVMPRVVPLAAVIRADGVTDVAAEAALRLPDESYLETTPGQRARLIFNVDTIARDSARTFLLATQGYYREWVRGAWLRQHVAGTAFVPSDAALAGAIQRWRDRQPGMERQFYDSRIPVR